jgi:hypothetical protein
VAAAHRRAVRALRCSVPAWREPAAFHVTSRDVRPHPTAAGVLLVTATFRNDARFAQPWPRLQLSLPIRKASRSGCAGSRRGIPRGDAASSPDRRRPIGHDQPRDRRSGKRAVSFDSPSCGR